MHTMEYDSGIILFLWSGKSNLTATASASVLVNDNIFSYFLRKDSCSLVMPFNIILCNALWSLNLGDNLQIYKSLAYEPA